MPLLPAMPNWLVVTEPAIKRVQKMAGDKYVALVADMYGEGKTCEGPPTSQEWMMAGAPTASKGESAPTQRWPAWWPKPTSAHR